MRKTIRNFIILLLLGIVAIGIYYLAIKNYNILFSNGKDISSKQALEENGISYIPYDNTKEKVKTLVIIKKITGIDKIQFLDDDGNNKEIECNGKKEIALDRELEVNKDYIFNVISNDTEEIETLRLKDDYINDFIKLSKVEDSKIKIDYADVINSKELKYKIAKENEWHNYADPFIIDDISNIDIEEIINGSKTTTLEINEKDKAGNMLISKSQHGVKDNGNFDIFKNVKMSGKTLKEYGFTSSWSNSQNTTFVPGNIGCGHWTDDADYSGTFNLNWTKLKSIKAQELYVGFMQYSEGGGAWVDSSVTVYYKDGTSFINQVNKRTSGGWLLYPATIALEDKEIDHIQFKIWGRDECWVSSQAYINQLILKRCSNIINFYK